MTPRARPPSLQSLLAKLRNRARQDRLPVDLMLLLYFYESFLARLAVSEFNDKLILKGGFNLYGRYQGGARPTRDVDLAGVKLPSTVDNMLNVIRVITEIDLADGIHFALDTLEGTSIMEGTNYGGVRAELVARYGTAFEKLTFDFSFGNAITPGPVRLEFPSLFGQPHPLLAYPLETIVAEKSAAIVEIGLTNTRLKDFYDLYYIARHESLQANVLRQACKRTFAARGTPLGQLELFETLGNDARLTTAWQSFLTRTGLSAPKDFNEVIQAIRTLLEPVIND